MNIRTNTHRHIRFVLALVLSAGTHVALAAQAAEPSGGNATAPVAMAGDSMGQAKMDGKATGDHAMADHAMGDHAMAAGTSAGRNKPGNTMAHGDMAATAKPGGAMAHPVMAGTMVPAADENTDRMKDGAANQ